MTIEPERYLSSQVCGYTCACVRTCMYFHIAAFGPTITASSEVSVLHSSHVCQYMDIPLQATWQNEIAELLELLRAEVCQIPDNSELIKQREEELK